MRIDKYISNSTPYSRKELKVFFKKGQVRVNGEVVTDIGKHIDEDTAEVFLANEKVEYARFTYLMLNKPAGYISATYDKKFPVVTDLVPEKYKHIDLFPVGRLDYETEGLLILTNDGDLAYRLTHPMTEIPKTYMAKIEGTLTEKDLNPIRSGIELDGVMTKKCKAHIVETNKAYTKVHITITEGKNRQVRRMFEAIGRNVELLRRVSIGQLKLTGLDRGEVRALTESEILYLKGL